MKSKFNKKVAVSAPQRDVVPLKTHEFQKAVTTIGFKVPGIICGELLKNSYAILKETLGGKGAGLVEMVKLGVTVPPAFNLSTSLCPVYLMRQKLPEVVIKQFRMSLVGLEQALGRTFGAKENPMLVSVRSGARVSMPGMMDTILNLGLNDEITKALAKTFPEKSRFWWDCYRRLIQMFSHVVLGFNVRVFEKILEETKRQEKVSSDSELSAQALQNLCRMYQEELSRAASKTFPQDPWTQLMMATEAVFRSWNTDRAVYYRKLHPIPEEWGTAVTVQAMVFGNLNDRSATGVVFTRNPSTGEKKLYGEYLVNAQGEDVVAGIRTPELIEKMKKALPLAYQNLVKNVSLLEQHFKEVQDVEFTVENGKLFILQTRTAKRTALAAIQHVIQFVKEKKITTKEGLSRIDEQQVKQLLHPTLKKTNEKPIGKGLPASPGAVSGKIVFDPMVAVEWARSGQKVILLRRETSPEDIMGMNASEGILTATGGMTSHAAVVGRGMGKACVVGCTELQIDEERHQVELNSIVLQEGAWITLNGSTGEIFEGQLSIEPVSWSSEVKTFFEWADKVAPFPVLANADTPDQARLARELGAKGIGLCRTEHMFFEKERIHKFRLMILSGNNKQRSEMVELLLPFQRSDFLALFKEMKSYSVSVRLLDPPLHEFLPKEEDHEELALLSLDLGVTQKTLLQRMEQLKEINPMLGHRGCRLGVTFPEIYEMQVRALAESFADFVRTHSKIELKIMIPLVMNVSELQFLLKRLKVIFDQTLRNKLEEKLLSRTISGVKWGTMIELPRACVTMKEIAPCVDFISFGTNDLTQTTLGISRDDASRFISKYTEFGLLPSDPFEHLDQEGVGRLIEIAVREGRRAHQKIEVGICGEHGGDPESISFFAKLKFNNVSCSPFRVPLARLVAARSL